jgi:hypothetical protein
MSNSSPIPSDGPAAPQAPLRRRDFLGSLAAAGTPVLALGSAAAAQAQPQPTLAHLAPPADATGELGSDEAFRRQAYDVRVAVARACLDVPVQPHPTNGDEERYPSRIGSDSRGLPHNRRGEVDPAAFRQAVKAYASGDPDEFEKIPLGGTRKQLNPIGSLAVSLTGLNPVQLAIPPAPALAGAQRAGEAVELYWQSLLRDVPFSEFRADTQHRDVLAAVQELNRLSSYHGPRSGGRITPQALFRGSALYLDPADRSNRTPRWVTPPGALEGPYVSQFLLRDAPLGTQSIAARIRTALPVNDYLTDYDEWLVVQNGGSSGKATQWDPMPRYIATGRDLAEYVHNNPAAFTVAAALLGTPASAGGLGVPLNPANPYLKSNKVDDYPIHKDLLDSQALDRSRAKFGSHLLAHVFPEGAPMHSAYPGGATEIAASNVTLLKAFFDENHVIQNPVQPDPSDPTRLVPYVGPPLTVGGELNKLALNYGLGRNWAGIHWRSDFAASLAQGEDVAISLLRDERATFRERFEGYMFTRFDGSRVTV